MFPAQLSLFVNLILSNIVVASELRSEHFVDLLRNIYVSALSGYHNFIWIIGPSVCVITSKPSFEFLENV